MFNRHSQRRDPLKDRVSKHLRIADELVKNKKYDDAMIEVEKALELDPKNMYIRAFHERTRFLIEKENESRTKTFGEMDMALDQRLETVSKLLANADELIKEKQYHKALGVVAKVYQIDPRNHYAQIYSERIELLMHSDTNKEIPKVPQPVLPDIHPATTYKPTQQQSMPASDMPKQVVDTPMQTIAPAISNSQNIKPEQKEFSNVIKVEEVGRYALYRELLKECWADGIVTPEESAMLHSVRTQHAISFEEHCRIEIEIKIDAYVDALRMVWQDGVVTDNEQEVLEIMRKKFGVTQEEQLEAERRFAELLKVSHTKSIILVIDPNQDDRISTARALISRGFDVKVARHPEEALKIMETKIPNLILSEVAFPQENTDGFDFFQKVHLNEKFQHIPFLMMTYHGDAHIIRAGLRMGADYFLPKPLNIDFMIAIVEGKLKNK